MRAMIVITMLVAAAQSGCVFLSKPLIDNQGKQVICSAWGWGWLGTPLAVAQYAQCESKYEALGYVGLAEVEKTEGPKVDTRPGIIAYPAVRPAWNTGDVWVYRVSGDGRSATHRQEVVDKGIVNSVSGYVLRVGEDRMFVSEDLNLVQTEYNKGAAVTTHTPPLRNYDWPLRVGKTWETAGVMKTVPIEMPRGPSYLLVRNAKFGEVPNAPEYVWVDAGTVTTTTLETQLIRGEQSTIAAPEVVARYSPSPGPISPRQGVPGTTPIPVPMGQIKTAKDVMVKDYGIVRVPAGEFEAFYIVSTLRGARVSEMWYAPSVRSHVKLVNYFAGGRVVAELISFMPSSVSSIPSYNAAAPEVKTSSPNGAKASTAGGTTSGVVVPRSDGPWLGVTFGSAARETLDLLGIREPVAAVVLFGPRSPDVPNVDLDPGDIVLAIDGVPVEGPGHIAALLSGRAPGSSVSVRTYRLKQREQVDQPMAVLQGRK
jgi:hypothetical protein